MIPIGISGVAGSGKDLFFTILKKRMPVKRYALADQLKLDLSEWCVRKYGIDPLNCPREDKEKIRDLMVFHGVFLRKKTLGRHWIEKIHPNIIKDIEDSSNQNVPVITDIRFSEFEKDEVHWLKNEVGGVLVHVSLYAMSNGYKMWRPAANKDETNQNPILKKSADYTVEWEKVKDSNPEQSKYLIEKVDEFINWYRSHERKMNLKYGT